LSFYKTHVDILIINDLSMEKANMNSKVEIFYYK
jgi:hypothetical protein